MQDGLPEEAGLGDMSLFQSATALWALPGVGGLRGLDATDDELARVVIETCARGLAYHADHGGTWPRQTYGQAASPSKTALSIIGLQRSLDAGMLPAEMEFGGSVGTAAVAVVENRISLAAAWLQEHTVRWVDYIEADPDVPGTQWSHLAYALALEALIVAGVPLAEGVLPGWASLDSSWSREHASWCEPTSPPSPTVRADFAAVRVHEAMLLEHGSAGLRELAHLLQRTPDDKTGAEYDLIFTRLNQVLLRPVGPDAEAIPLDLAGRDRDLLLTLAGDPGAPRAWAASDLARAMAATEGSVGQLVRRLRQAVQATVPGLDIVRSKRGAGYRLNVRAVRRAD